MKLKYIFTAKYQWKQNNKNIQISQSQQRFFLWKQKNEKKESIRKNDDIINDYDIK